MAVQYSVPVNNGRLDSIETTIGTSPVLVIRTGSRPAATSSANTGTILVTMTLPSDWMSNASGGVKAKTNTWLTTSANNSGTAGHFRIYDSTSTTCHMQGTVSSVTGDMMVDSTSFVAGQPFLITSFSIIAGNT